MRPQHPSEIGLAADRLRLSGLEAGVGEVGAGGWVPEQPAFPAAPQPSSPAVPVPAARSASMLDRLPLWAKPWLQPASGRGLAWLVGACALALVVSAWALFHRPSAPAPAFAAPSSAPASAPAAVPVQQIVVDVGGRVRHPGLVTLAQGARVADALRAAGGALRASDIATLDLAARLSDGQLLLIGLLPTAGGGGGGSQGGAAAPVSLNTATVDELDALPGVGPVLAHHIVEWREAHGGFTSVSQLQDVTGVGPRTFERLKGLVVV